MAEFRWTLLGLGVLLIAGIWWWGVRRSRRLPGNSQLRESAAPSISNNYPSGAATVATARADPVESRDWGVPPFEALSIRTAQFDDVHVVDLPMTADPAPFDAPFAEEPPAEIDEPLPADVEAPRAEEPAPTAEAVPAEAPQRVVTLRVCAPGDAPWVGADLLAALESQNLSFGRYKVFHRTHDDGQTMFCAASLVEPGTFDLARMPHETFRGLTLFAVLPGPVHASDVVDALIAAALALAQALQGEVQDSKGAPLTAQLAEALRADAAP